MTDVYDDNVHLFTTNKCIEFFMSLSKMSIETCCMDLYMSRFVIIVAIF